MPQKDSIFVQFVKSVFHIVGDFRLNTPNDKLHPGNAAAQTFVD